MVEKTINDTHWYAFRIFHNKIKLLKVQLADDGVEFFIPSRLVEKKLEDSVVYLEEPIIPSLIFIRTSEEYLTVIKQRYATHLSVYTIPGSRKPAIISNQEMEVFIFVLSKGCKQLETVDENLVKGNHVRITGGLFEGAEGYITRVHGTKRFVVMIKGIAAVATTFVPRCFIEKIED